MEFEDIKRKVLDYQQQGKKIFTSSSFQTHSIPLLHIISRIDPSVPVYFINTGFHFPETLEYRDQIARLLGLNLIDLRPETPKSMQIGPDGKFLFSTDPDHCCHLNKTKPMESLLMHYDIWVNGIRADQSPFRKSMDVEQPAPHNVIRFHPLISWSTRMVHEYRKKYNLPEHPLEAKGYFSIGCEPCTRKHDPDLYEREARWYGLKKTECGLHTELVQTP